MVKTLKDIDYYKLVITIFRASNLEKEKLILIYKYVGSQIINNNFNTCYLDKLAFDLKLMKETEEMGNTYTYCKEYEKELDILIEDRLKYYQYVELRSNLYDIFKQAYHE